MFARRYKNENQTFFSLILFVVLFVPSLVAAQTTEFTYQGKLTDGLMAANASYDFDGKSVNGIRRNDIYRLLRNIKKN